MTTYELACLLYRQVEYTLDLRPKVYDRNEYTLEQFGWVVKFFYKSPVIWEIAGLEGKEEQISADEIATEKGYTYKGCNLDFSEALLAIGIANLLLLNLEKHRENDDTTLKQLQLAIYSYELDYMDTLKKFIAEDKGGAAAKLKIIDLFLSDKYEEKAELHNLYMLVVRHLKLDKKVWELISPKG